MKNIIGINIHALLVSSEFQSKQRVCYYQNCKKSSLFRRLQLMNKYKSFFCYAKVRFGPLLMFSTFNSWFSASFLDNITGLYHTSIFSPSIYLLCCLLAHEASKKQSILVISSFFKHHINTFRESVCLSVQTLSALYISVWFHWRHGYSDTTA